MLEDRLTEFPSVLAYKDNSMEETSFLLRRLFFYFHSHSVSPSLIMVHYEALVQLVRASMKMNNNKIEDFLCHRKKRQRPSYRLTNLIQSGKMFRRQDFFTFLKYSIIF